MSWASETADMTIVATNKKIIVNFFIFLLVNG